MGSNFDFNATSTKVIAPVKLAHVVLRTNQIDAMGDFYVTFLGGEYSMKAPGLYFITYDDEHHRIALIGMPHLKKADRTTTGLEVSFFLMNSSTIPFLSSPYPQTHLRPQTSHPTPHSTSPSPSPPWKLSSSHTANAKPTTSCPSGARIMGPPPPSTTPTQTAT